MSAAWHPDGKRVSVWIWGPYSPIPGFWTGPVAGGVAVRSEIDPAVVKIADSAAGGHGRCNSWGDSDSQAFSWAPSGKAMYFERTLQWSEEYLENERSIPKHCEALANRAPNYRPRL